MSAKRKGGTEVSIYLPHETIKEIDKRKGEYLSRSRFVYWALNEFLKGNDISDGIDNMIEKFPQGAGVHYKTPRRNDHSPTGKQTQLSAASGGVSNHAGQ